MIAFIKRLFDVDGRHTDHDRVWRHVEDHQEDECSEPAELRKLTTQAIQIHGISTSTQ